MTFFENWQVFLLLKAGLHYSDYHSRLVHFEAQKKIFSMLIRHSVNTTLNSIPIRSIYMYIRLCIKPAGLPNNTFLLSNMN